MVTSLSSFRIGAMRRQFGNETLAPIQRIRKRPGRRRFVHSIPRPDKVIGRRNIAGRIRHHVAPAIAPRPCFQGSHQAQLKATAPVALQHANPAEITGVANMGRRQQAGKGDGLFSATSKPPVPTIEGRNGSAIKKCQAMQLKQDIHDLVITSIHLTDRIVFGYDLRHRLARSISLGEKPLARANASTVASPYCATARLTTQHGTASAGGVASMIKSNAADIIFRVWP